jgi:XTP/dITP diphosphohydrolase
MNEFLLASSNPHKAQEFAALFDPLIITIKTAPKTIEVHEGLDSFEENALTKAKAYFDIFKRPVMSDDSGLTVEALPGELGVHSARFGGQGLSSEERCHLLLSRLEGVPVSKRKAFFTCVLCFYYGSNEIYFFEGHVHGKIGYRPQGEKGFGYDPLFIPDEHHADATLAMLPEWKMTHSHRARACKAAEKFFRGRLCQKPRD